MRGNGITAWRRDFKNEVRHSTFENPKPSAAFEIRLWQQKYLREFAPSSLSMSHRVHADHAHSA